MPFDIQGALFVHVLACATVTAPQATALAAFRAVAPFINAQPKGAATVKTCFDLINNLRPNSFAQVSTRPALLKRVLLNTACAAQCLVPSAILSPVALLPSHAGQEGAGHLLRCTGHQHALHLRLLRLLWSCLFRMFHLLFLPPQSCVGDS